MTPSNTRTERSPIDRTLFSARAEAVCVEMGAVLRRAALSPNIKDRLDFSCALFDRNGDLLAQSAAIPVHLGSMAYAMGDLVNGHRWQAGQHLIVNDPFMGGTHLPDVTLISALHIGDELVGFVANRAHHADIGSEAPGSMPISRSIEQEGCIIPPTLLDTDARQPFAQLVRTFRDPQAATADFSAQMAANKSGLAQLRKLVAVEGGFESFQGCCMDQNEYAAALARAALAEIPNGVYEFTDTLDSDGFSTKALSLKIKLTVLDGHVTADFSGSCDQVTGNLNCPLPVTAAAVMYALRGLMPSTVPQCAGLMATVTIDAPGGSILNARHPAAVAAGNVETSQRVCDLVLGALAQAVPDRIPAASQGTMNNVAMGGHWRGSAWSYYETIGGGMGGGANYDGQSAVQCHMTNTLNTPAEVLEQYCPVRIERYRIRTNSGGRGEHSGGDGITREYRFLEDAEVSIIGERRVSRPWGLWGGQPGRPAEDRLDGEAIPAKTSLSVRPNQLLTIATPGGGGWCPPAQHDKLK